MTMGAGRKYVTNCGIPRRTKGVTGFTHSPGGDSRDGILPRPWVREQLRVAYIPLKTEGNFRHAGRGSRAGDRPGGRGMGLA